MKRPSVHDIVFNRQFPKPKQTEPQNFYAHVQRHLVPEVRIEVQTFYGALDTLEAQYPGLDYTYEPHRKRLSRFPWHRRLFRVFDELRLTRGEILSICQWEGTKSAKDKYEAETGRTIVDTTLDGVSVAPKDSPKAVVYARLRRQPSTETMAHVGAMEQEFPEAEHSDEENLDVSVGAHLNHQLMAAADGDCPNEGPLEEWLKYMTEREADRDSMLQAIRAGHPPPTMLDNIRAGAVVGSSDAIASSSNGMQPYRNITATSQVQSYGPTNEEVLATLERRVQA